ncbi:protein NLRC3-like [Thalassophryne amazonica]|uniref:protein NLRC3-like n=1 Tax=Thalassophryne amazonica TaxID=390379 RepID=UPI00147086CB|nr:protein NLRC3-like [Thalassophryne amazonica]
MFQHVAEGITNSGQQILVNKIYTELYITEEGSEEVNASYSIRQIEKSLRKNEHAIKMDDFFQPIPGQDESKRTVMTKGVAGIGKTVLMQKFVLDWADDRVNQNIQLLFPFTFLELNLLKEEKYSLVELIHHFFLDTKKSGLCHFDNLQIVFIFDGLDECELLLDFYDNEILNDITELALVDVLLTNLIMGNLLASAGLWITTTPEAASRIPPEYVHVVMEIKGFTDPKKEEYIWKIFRNKELSNRIISQIKTSRSLNIMCHIPLICWITANVLEDQLNERGNLPKTMTELYMCFLQLQSKLATIKYNQLMQREPHWNTESRRIILSLRKLAFEQLQKGTVMFHESDLRKSGISTTAALLYPGVFTHIFREDCQLYKDKMFGFVHLSFQEFLAALYVVVLFFDFGVNLLSDTPTTSQKSVELTLKHLCESAVDKALDSPNGHLNLFLRFLVGLSQKTSETLLQEPLERTDISNQGHLDGSWFGEKQ